MKKILFSMVVIFTLSFVGQAMAEPSPYDLRGRYPKQTGLYLAGKILYSMQEASKDGAEDDNVMGGGVALGYNFYGRQQLFPMRVELEYLMRETGKYNFSGTAQEYGVDTFMVNGAIGFNTGTKLTPYITGGIGAAFVDGKFPRTGDDVLGSDTNLAWSLGADLTYSLNHNILLGLEYKFINFGQSEIDNAGFKGKDLEAQEILFAVRYKF